MNDLSMVGRLYKKGLVDWCEWEEGGRGDVKYTVQYSTVQYKGI